MKEETVALNKQSDVVTARQIGRDIAKMLGFGTADQTRIATAISEIARNAIQYAGAGVCKMKGYVHGSDRTVEVMIEDHGPGIKNINKAMEDGFSTSKGLGAGLPGAKRLMHDFTIESGSGGTRVTMRMKRKMP